MKFGILGTGMVGDTLASKLVTMGHDVMMGSRTANNPKALAWQQRAGAHALHLQHRLARREHSARVSGSQGGQGAQHRQLPGDDRSHLRARRARSLHLRQRRRCQAKGRRVAARFRLEADHRLGRHHQRPRHRRADADLDSSVYDVRVAGVQFPGQEAVRHQSIKRVML